MSVEFVSKIMPHTILRGHWCDIIVLNIHAPPENEIADVKDRFYWGWKVYLINALNKILTFCLEVSMLK
jgi:hypothetical protein